MRILFKLLMKLLMMVLMVLLSAGGLKYGTRVMTRSPAGTLGPAGEQVTTEEADLMSTVMESALRLVSGKATRSELANELSDKLYAQRGDAGDMSELGIDLVKTNGAASPPGIGAEKSDPKVAAKADPKANAKAETGPPKAAIAGAPAGAATGTAGAAKADSEAAAPELVSGKSQAALNAIWLRIKPFAVELCLIPVVFLGMVLVTRVRRRKLEASIVPEFTPVLSESDAETHEMKHPAGSLTDEEFELLAAMIYQRQGYRVSLPAGLGGGRSGNFKLARKSERLLVKCEKMNAEHRVPVERVRELHDAMTDANATGGLYVTSSGFTWDARHFAKTRRIKLISGKTLDALLTAASGTPGEDLLAITPWIDKFMTKVELTTPHCPECEVEMERETEGKDQVWFCTQRPECSGRRVERRYKKVPRKPPKPADLEADAVPQAQPVPVPVAPTRSEPILAQHGQQPVPHVAPPQHAIDAPGRIPPVLPGRQSPSLRVKQPAAEKPAASPGQGAGAIPPAVPKAQSPTSQVTQPAAPEPAPVSTEGAGPRKKAAARIIRPDVPKRRGFIIVENPPVAPRPTPSPMRSAGSIPPPAPKPRNAPLPVTRPATPMPAPNPPRANATAGTKDAGGIPPALPKRRGFRLAENERLTLKKEPKPTGSSGK